MEWKERLRLGLVLLGLCFFAACGKEQLYKNEDLRGRWLRYHSNKPIYDSMVVEVEGNFARISSIPPNDYFNPGDIKWQNISPSKDSIFSYEELGSDGNYYSGTIILSHNLSDSFEILSVLPNVNSGANGSEQIWIKIP